MNYKIITTKTFQMQVRQLMKKYRSLKDDLNTFEEDENINIYLLSIYDKGEQETVSDKEILILKQKNGL